MAQPHRGRPPNPVDPDASAAARLGAELRARRTAARLTLQTLSHLADGYTPQYISEAERAKTRATPAFVAAVDRALNADCALEELLPAAMREHELQRQARAAARRAAGTGEQTRAWCALRTALGHALAHDQVACERSLDAAYRLADHNDSPVPPWAGKFRYTPTAVRGGEAQCWLSMRPRKAIPLYERALRDWPRDEARTGGLHRARLALACADAGERDRAETEGRKASAIARATKSAAAARDLTRLKTVLNAA